MASARFDPLAGRWVIVAPGRARRPDTLAPPGRPRPGDDTVPPDCPFCPGNEHLTPPEVARTGPGGPGEPGWRTRVVPNRYPLAGDASDEPAATTDPPSADPLRLRRPARGAHEVVVLSPDHRRPLGRLDRAEVVEVLSVLRDRARVHAARGYRSVQAFVNQGLEGGASLAHPHAQIVAVDLDPPVVLGELERMAPPEGCLICREIERHRADRSLLVAASEADLWCPWASGTAFEMLVAPRHHRPRFEDAAEELPAVAELLREGLARLDGVVPGAPYNVAVHSRPGLSGDFHWHVHVWPRLQREAGFERGSGLLVDIVDPERAAELLRASPATG